MRTPRLLLPLLACTVALVALRPPDGALGMPVDRYADVPRVDGEYGLFVREAGRDLEVRWLTREPAEGVLEVWNRGRLVHATTTPLAESHLAVFPRPRRGDIVLRYGAADDASDRHETSIRPGAGARRAGFSFSGIDSVFVVGDVHGEFDTLIDVLRNAGVIDERLRWSAGRSHLVLLGDLFDRGPDVTRLLWFVYGLEWQAEQARGRVHTVLGNHEIMVMKEDVRYVAPKEMLIAHLHGTSYGRMFDPRHSVLGQWLATKPAILRINDVLYAHGGVTADYATASLHRYDEILAAFMKEDLFYHWADTTVAIRLSAEQVGLRTAFFWGENSVFWFRGYVQSDEHAESLARVLRHFRSTLHVVAHTPVASIAERHAGSLIAVNVAQPASELLLLVRDGRQTRRYRWRLTGPPEPLAPSATTLSPAPGSATAHRHHGSRRAASDGSGRARAARSSP